MQSAVAETCLLLSRILILLLPLLLPPLPVLPLPVLLLLPPLEDPLEVEHDVTDDSQVQSLPGLLPGGTDETVGLTVP